ncbi:MAG: hypothetical protein U5K38_17255 [Woeseiaceae bacterium]|nr:hypothetical protein [Woeseiaceae bacterium]
MQVSGQQAKEIDERQRDGGQFPRLDAEDAYQECKRLTDCLGIRSLIGQTCVTV